MIGLFLATAVTIAQSAIYSGHVPSYDADCTVILADHREFETKFEIRGQGSSRRAVVTSGETRSELSVRPSSPGKYDGVAVIDDVVLVPDGTARLQYGFRYFHLTPAETVTLDLWRVSEPGGMRQFGTGLCWTKVVAQ